MGELGELRQAESAFLRWIRPIRYSLNTETAINTIVMDRDFEAHMNILGLTVKSLGQYVLDLGSGYDENFSKKAAHQGIKVTSVNPQLIEKRGRQAAKRTVESASEWQKRSVSAISQALPFADESFDSVVSVYGVPYFLFDRESLQSTFSEIIRVLKPGGRAILAPLKKSKRAEIKEILSQSGIFYEEEEIPEAVRKKYFLPVEQRFRLIIKKPA